MSRRFLLPGLMVLTSSLLSSNVLASEYPTCWIRRGECLDQNEGPLKVGVKPQINENVIGSPIKDVLTFDDCVTECLANAECRFFTYYTQKIPLHERTENNKTCHLVGFNLEEPCFNMEKTCVLLKECLEYNSDCDTCLTGMRPLLDPKDEPLTLVLNGIQDNRTSSTEDYSERRANVNELVMESGDTCLLNNAGMTRRFGSVAGYIDGKVINCGGFTEEPEPDGTYLDLCEKFTDKMQPWNETAGSLQTPRAFAASVLVPRTDNPDESVLYIMGGYNRDDGFLDSVEKFDSASETFAIQTAMAMPVKKSHFCLVMAAPDNDGERYLYSIGGWNIDYLSEVKRMKIDATGSGSAWEDFSQNLGESRADHACAEVQIDATRKGILVAGGYRVDGSWLSSVEFMDYEKGEWMPTVFFPRLIEGRHYHGITTINMIPQVFGGWNNGSLNTVEYLDSCSKELTWRASPRRLIERREKFAVARVPKSFVENCY